MRLLFNIDKKDYIEKGTVCSRPSSRGIYIKDNKIALVYSNKYGYYKFPGGGIENKETPIEALIREMKEETGLTVISNSIKEYGYAHIIHKGLKENIFIQDNYYYFINCENSITTQNLDDYEEEEGFCLKFVTYEEAKKNNEEYLKRNNYDFAIRDTLILDLLFSEKYVK